jgi:hypothetical protein
MTGTRALARFGLTVLVAALVMGPPGPASGESLFSSLGLGEHLLPASAHGAGMGGVGFSTVDTSTASFLNPAVSSLLNRVTLSIVWSPEVRDPAGVPGVSRNWESRLTGIKIVFPFPRRVALGVGLLLSGDMNSRAVWTGSTSSSVYAGSYDRQGGTYTLPVHVSVGIRDRLMLAAGVERVQISSRETWTKDFPSSNWQDEEDVLETSFSGVRASAGVLLRWSERLSAGFVFNGPRDLKGDLVTTPTFGTEYSTPSTLRYPASYGGGVSVGLHPGWTLSVEGFHTNWGDVRIGKTAPLPDRTASRVAVGLERVPAHRAGHWFSRLPLRLGYWREPQAFDWPAGERVVYQMFTLGTGFPLRGSATRLDLALEVGRIGSRSDNGAQETITRLVVGFTGSEAWHRKRQTQY